MSHFLRYRGDESNGDTVARAAICSPWAAGYDASRSANVHYRRRVARARECTSRPIRAIELPRLDLMSRCHAERNILCRQRLQASIRHPCNLWEHSVAR